MNEFPIEEINIESEELPLVHPEDKTDLPNLAQPTSLEQLKSKVLSLENLSDDERKKLQERIKSWKGSVRVFVHPFYEEYDEEDFDIAKPKIVSRKEHTYYKVFNEEHTEEDKLRRKEAMQQILIQFIDAPAGKVPPIFIFEEEGNLDGFINILNSRLSHIPSESLYTISTLSTRPTPLWGKNFISEELEKLKIKEFLIAGTYLELDDDKDGTEYYQKCVGGVIRMLAKIGNVELSSLAYPHSRMDDTRNGGKIKRENDKL